MTPTRNTTDRELAEAEMATRLEPRELSDKELGNVAGGFSAVSAVLKNFGSALQTAARS